MADVLALLSINIGCIFPARQWIPDWFVQTTVTSRVSILFLACGFLTVETIHMTECVNCNSNVLFERAIPFLNAPFFGRALSFSKRELQIITVILLFSELQIVLFFHWSSRPLQTHTTILLALNRVTAVISPMRYEEVFASGSRSRFRIYFADLVESSVDWARNRLSSAVGGGEGRARRRLRRLLDTFGSDRRLVQHGRHLFTKPGIFFAWRMKWKQFSLIAWFFVKMGALGDNKKKKTCRCMNVITQKLCLRGSPL